MWLSYFLIALAALLALSCLNLIGGHTRKLKDLFRAEYEREEDRLTDAQTVLTQIAVGRRGRYLQAFALTFVSAGVFVVFTAYSIYVLNSYFQH